VRRFHDPVLPGLATALQADRVREMLQRSLPECSEKFRLEDLKTRSVRYEPGRRCMLLYTARFRGPRGGRSGSWPLAAIVLPEGRTPPDPSAGRRSPRGSPVRTAFVRVPECGMAIYPYPFDPLLPELARACNTVEVRQALMAAWTDRGVRPRRVSVERLGYTPFARAALAFEILGERRDTGLPEVRRLVGKLDAGRSATDLFARSLAMWHAARGQIDLVPPVGYLPSLGLFLQERVDGTRLADLASGARFVKRVRQAARSAARFHGLELPLRSRRGPRREASSVRRWGTVLSAIRPDGASRVRRLCDRIAADLEERAAITGPVHADLHPANLLVSRDRLILIDLDNAALGDRLLDVGRFLASIRTTSFRVHGCADGLSAAGDAFLEKYLAVSGEDESRARLFEAACLITSAGTGFRLQRNDWECSADALIEAAEGALERSQRRTVSRAHSAMSSVGPGPEARRTWAANAEYVRAMLHGAARQRYGVEITHCRVQPRREQSKAMRYRYRVSGRRDGAAWHATFEGVLRNRGRGHRAAVRLSTVALTLASAGAGLLPEPVAFLPEIGLLVVEVPSGVPLPACLSKVTGCRAVETLACDLAKLHEVEVDLDRVRSLDEEMLALKRLVESTNGQRLSFRRRFETIASRVSTLPELRQPVLRRLPPNKIVCNGDDVAVADVDDVVLSHPCIDAADFLARLKMMQGLNGNGPAIAEAAERFRAAYLRHRPVAVGALEIFEAAALLRLACVEGRHRPEGRLSHFLLAAMEERSS
jgi:aminoglycoside phosphotransferase (APT) family kinase protein